ncbi:unnamed protein product [Natator depressus]
MAHRGVTPSRQTGEGPGSTTPPICWRKPDWGSACGGGIGELHLQEGAGGGLLSSAQKSGRHPPAGCHSRGSTGRPQFRGGPLAAQGRGRFGRAPGLSLVAPGAGCCHVNVLLAQE